MRCLAMKSKAPVKARHKKPKLSVEEKECLMRLLDDVIFDNRENLPAHCKYVRLIARKLSFIL